MQNASTQSSGSSFDVALVIFAAILQIAVSFLSSLGIGTPIGENSDRVSTLVTPAGWAFSIWGALYLAALIFAAYQALSAQRNDALIAQIRRPAAVAFLANASWATYVQLVDVTFLSVIIILSGAPNDAAVNCPITPPELTASTRSAPVAQAARRAASTRPVKLPQLSEGPSISSACH